jgi:hypothetical protein
MGGVHGTRWGGNKCIQKVGENKTGNIRTNVTYKRIRITTVAMRSNKSYIFQVCVCSLSYLK